MNINLFSIINNIDHKQKKRLHWLVSYYKSGFTLIELLVAVMLSAFIVVGASYALLTVTKAEQESTAQTNRRQVITRGLNYILENVREANQADTTAPSWAWDANLGAGTPGAKLYLQIPLRVTSITQSDDKINVPAHGFDNSNAVMFADAGILPSELSPHTRYYVVNSNADDFQVASSPGGTPSDFSSDSSGNVYVYKLVIYYLRDATFNWIPPKTVNRSLGDCQINTTTYPSNCPVLVDSVDDFTVSVSNGRKVDISIYGNGATSLQKDKFKAQTGAIPDCSPGSSTPQEIKNQVCVEVEGSGFARNSL